MCQFNIVFVKNAKSKKILKESAYHSFGNKFNNFFPYVKGHCNCGSFVGTMSEYAGNSYFEMIESLNKSELERLNQIKDFMLKPDYVQLRNAYMETRNSFSNILETFFEHLSNYEMEQLGLLEQKYKGKELEKHIGLLYQDLENKIKNIENSFEYKSAQRMLNEFIEKNKLMEESTFYFLTKDDEDKENAYSADDELFLENEGFDLLEEVPNFTSVPDEDSLVIGSVIKRLENRFENDYNSFLEYKCLFEKLLENEDCILFSCVWDEPGKMIVQKEVSIQDLSIEDMASLEFDDLLKIYK